LAKSEIYDNNEEEKGNDIAYKQDDFDYDVIKRGQELEKALSRCLERYIGALKKETSNRASNGNKYYLGEVK
jgi:hypothetical protein